MKQLSSHGSHYCCLWWRWWCDTVGSSHKVLIVLIVVLALKCYWDSFGWGNHITASQNCASNAFSTTQCIGWKVWGSSYNVGTALVLSRWVGCLLAMSQNCFASKPKTLLIGVMQSGTELHHQVLFFPFVSVSTSADVLLWKYFLLCLVIPHSRWPCKIIIFMCFPTS